MCCNTVLTHSNHRWTERTREPFNMGCRYHQCRLMLSFKTKRCESEPQDQLLRWTRIRRYRVHSSSGCPRNIPLFLLEERVTSSSGCQMTFAGQAVCLCLEPVVR